MNNVADNETRKTPMRFIWMPGIRPVKIPAMIPAKRKRIIWKSMREERFNN